MVLVNPDVQVRLMDGKVVAAKDLAFFGVRPDTQGRYEVPQQSIVNQPGQRVNVTVGPDGFTYTPGGPRYGNPLVGSPPPAAAANPPAATNFNGDAFAQLRQYLSQFGLDSLAPTVEQWMREGISANEALLRLYETSEFKSAFPEIDEYRRRGFPGALTPAAIIEYRQRFNQLVNERGLADAFPDLRKAAFDEMAVRGRSLGEVASRFDLLEGNVAALAAADPQTQADLEAWERYYGQRPTLGNLVAMALNPNEAVPALQRKFSAVKFDVAAGRAGFGDLSRQEAERITDLGSDPRQAEQTFSALASGRELYRPLDRGEDEITRDEQLSAGFSNNAAARKRIEDRARRRTAQFEGGGRLATGRSGYTGLSTSPAA